MHSSIREVPARIECLRIDEVYAQISTIGKTPEEVTAELYDYGVIHLIFNTMYYGSTICQTSWRRYLNEKIKNYEGGINTVEDFKYYRELYNAKHTKEELLHEAYLLTYKIVKRYIRYKEDPTNVYGYIRMWFPAYYVKMIRKFVRQYKNSSLRELEEKSYIISDSLAIYENIDYFNNKYLNRISDPFLRSIWYNSMHTGERILKANKIKIINKLKEE